MFKSIFPKKRVQEQPVHEESVFLNFLSSYKYLYCACIKKNTDALINMIQNVQELCNIIIMSRISIFHNAFCQPYGDFNTIMHGSKLKQNVFIQSAINKKKTNVLSINSSGSKMSSTSRGVRSILPILQACMIKKKN